MLSNIINRNLIIVEPDTKVAEAARLMAEKDVGSVMVLSNDRPRGIITDRDIVIRCVAENIDVNDCTVEQVMSETLHCVNETDGIFDCIKKMHDARVRRMPVVDKNGKAIGILSFGDLLGVLSKEFYELTSTTTSGVAQEDIELEVIQKAAA